MGRDAVTLLPDPAPASGKVVRRAVLFGVLLVVAALSTLIPLPYVVLSPGPAVDALGSMTRDGKQVDVVTVPTTMAHATTGSIDLTTVRLLGGPGARVSLADLAYAWVDGRRDVYPRDLLFPPEVTEDQVREENAAEMHDSQQDAAAVALAELGYAIDLVVSIRELTPQSPATGVLQAGDVVLEVGGAAVTSAQSVRDAIIAVAPGASVEMVIRREGMNRTVRVPTTTSEDGKTVVGVFLATALDLPINVTINAGDIGGPSAGLVFALAVYDKLTDGALTGGAKIAGTGTMALDGTVGPIGGIRQKMYGARDAGAQWFLAPADNCREVVGAVPDGLRAVKVATFDEAVAAVQAIGAGTGPSLPTCSVG
jgi:PDZ domain-containing protein